ncbi:MAG: EscU/YscU/HrcU family type III secretion system export apparatus switch protein [Nitrospinae bacterium]|nr:EscU/YscU/HrcU family type III secretion system export apparatus switch protein [Nitrospinota bacterium]
MSTSEERKKAVAMKYDPRKKDAPKIVAKGEHHIAERIIELAKEHGVAIHEDVDLVNVLSKLDLQQEIPEELYQVVAEVLVFVYQQNKAMEDKLKRNV